MGHGFRTDFKSWKRDLISSSSWAYSNKAKMISLTPVRLNTLFLRNRKGLPPGLICEGWLCREHKTVNWLLQCAEMNLALVSSGLKPLKPTFPLRLTRSVYMLTSDETISLFQVSTAFLRGQYTVSTFRSGHCND